VLEVERTMPNMLSSVLERIAKIRLASNRGRDLLHHEDLAHQFALVAPLGGGAIVALDQALRESDPGPLSRRGRPSWRGAVSLQA